MPFRRPDWIGNFKTMTSRYCLPLTPGEFAKRFPWVQLYHRSMKVHCATFQPNTGGGTSKDNDSLRHSTEKIVTANVMRGGDTRRPSGCHLCPERIFGIFSCGKSRGDQAGRDIELKALPFPGPQLRPASGFGNVRVPAG